MTTFRSNNIMFSYKDDQLIEDDDPIIIDYQLVNFGHPVYDLVSSGNNLAPILGNNTKHFSFVSLS